MASKRILIIALEQLERDIRIQKQITTLQKHYEVTVAAFSKPPIEGVEFRLLKRQDAKVALPWLSWRLRGELTELRFKLASYLPSLWQLEPHDVVLCNDVKSLPLGVWLKQRWNCALVLDAHEYAPGERKVTSESGKAMKKGKRMAAICEKCFPVVDGAVTVSSGIVKLYAENFGLEARMLPNVPYFEEHDLKDREITEPFQLIYHGTAARGRGLMELLELAALVAPRWNLNLMLVPLGGRSALENYELVVAEAEKVENISIKDPVPADEVVAEISQYDAGVYLMPGESPNKVYALPNKFFDYLQAGLAAFVGPELVEMSDFVRTHGCGAVSEEHTPKSMAELLLEIDEARLAELKERSRAIAPRWCHEKQEHILLEVVEQAIARASK